MTTKSSVTVTCRQHDTLVRVRDRARLAAAAGQEKVAISEPEYQLAKKKFLALQASGVAIPEKVREIAKRMGFLA